MNNCDDPEFWEGIEVTNKEECCQKILSYGYNDSACEILPQLTLDDDIIRNICSLLFAQLKKQNPKLDKLTTL